MSAEQALASDPSRSVWVSASAGSGKTAALTNRVLRLVLHGAPPESLLCVTYTKAAAAEMTARVVDTLETLLIADDATVAAVVARTGDAALSASSIPDIRARAAAALETSYRLHIETIHAFCVRLLEEFAGEAGFCPGILFADERQSAEWLREAYLEVYNTRSGPGDDITRAYDTVCRNMVHAKDFIALLPALADCADVIDDGSYMTALRLMKAALDIPDTVTSSADAYRDSAVLPSLAVCTELLGLLPDPSVLKGKTAREKVTQITAFLQAIVAQESASYDIYRRQFFTQAGTPQKALLDAPGKKAFPDAEDALRAEQERLIQAEDMYYALKSAEYSAALLTAALPVLAAYDAQKRRLNAMDFRDMIRYAAALLRQGDGILNVLYRLDRRIKHILVDEAQDTSPAQWDIIHALTEEFLSTQQGDEARTLFVVGDEKQSIFRFQGADPKQFASMRALYEHKHKQVNRPFSAVALRKVYRCAPAILRFTDVMITENNLENAVSSHYETHIPAREQADGNVVLHPLLIAEKTTPADGGAMHPWLHYALSPDESVKASDVAAAAIAATVAALIGTPTDSRPDGLHAGDIMVLVRQRGSIADALRRAFAANNIAVAPPDRVHPLSHLIAKDLLALLQVCSAPEEDDLALAALLRSPFFRIDDATLEGLCIGREKETPLYMHIESLAEQGDANAAHITQTLTRYMPKARGEGVAAFFAYALYHEHMMAKYRYIYPEDADIVAANLLEYAAAFDAESGGIPEFFLQAARTDAPDIKREQERASGVRIMTIHGSKGLQAPVVIMADAAGNSTKPPHILMTDTAPPLPLHIPPKAKRPAAADAMVEKAKADDNEEKYRLLYVALTRAVDALHIFGAVPSNRTSAPPESYYALAERVMQTHGEGGEGGCYVMC